ncbi:MAG: cyclase family protein [Candidatus Lokiarchaeota archaeon]|nr:cyclase family protein [Candidatus Lokiarchaeota archaeon]
MVKIHDISLKINKDTIVYPGNEKVSIFQFSSIPNKSVNESWIKFGCHTGTHVDSPRHIRNEGYFADKLPLESFYGKCKVFDLTYITSAIYRKDLEKFSINQDDIILLKTENSIKGYQDFRKDFIHIKFNAAKYLVQKKIKTLGVDYLSVKKFGNDDEVHEIIIDNMTLFEGLDLSKIESGEYLFIGLPLKIESDGAPARVILIEN